MGGRHVVGIRPSTYNQEHNEKHRTNTAVGRDTSSQEKGENLWRQTKMD